MTHNIERVRPPDQIVLPEEPKAERITETPKTKRFWQRPWIIPLWLVTAAFVYLQSSPFVGVPESQAPTPPHDGFPAYFPLLITHIAFGTVSMFAVCFQVWPWFRRRFPAVHRGMGRVYLVACLITAACGLIIVPFAPVPGQVGVTMATVLWVAFTLAGFWAIRSRRYAQHRRYMLFSFALVMNNVWGQVMVQGVFALGLSVDFNYLLEATRWIGWVVNMMLVQWWLNRTASRPIEKPTPSVAR